MLCCGFFWSSLQRAILIRYPEVETQRASGPMEACKMWSQESKRSVYSLFSFPTLPFSRPFMLKRDSTDPSLSRETENKKKQLKANPVQ